MRVSLNVKEGVKKLDIFEQRIRDEKEISPADSNIAMERYKRMCTCPKCPTYTPCAHDEKELLFCLQGKSFLCISGEKGCICPKCPVTAELGLKYRFFCTKGAEKAQRYEGALWGSTVPYTEGNR
jgi:hypothetical protein